MMNILIVGAGVAGICISRQFIKSGHKVTVIDAGNNHSTRVAAGMINPMTFRKMVKTWEGDILLPYLTKFYRAFEQETNQRFFFERKIRRVFSTEHEKTLWNQRLQESQYNDYIVELKEDTPDYVKHTYDSGVVNAPGYIDSPKFLHAAYDWLNTNAHVIIEEFDYAVLDATKTTYQNIPYDWIVFAEGYRGKDNPYFAYLPLQQTKGEVLTLSIANLKRDEIVNRKCFILPTEDGLAKLGATFSWNTTDVSSTEEGRNELLEQYHDLIDLPYKITGHEAGIRPTVTDRRPLLGKHPKHNGLVVFNGMGTKGYMLAPYFSEVLVNHLTNGIPLPVEVAIERFKKHLEQI
jgi:glycine oxidase